MKALFILSCFTISLLFGLEDYPFLTKPVPKPEKKELPLTPKIKERNFNEKMDAYNKCKHQGKTDKQCSELLGNQYDFSFEYKPE